MVSKQIKAIYLVLSVLSLLPFVLHAQNTQIRGFADVLATYEKGKTSFGFDEQDLFITYNIQGNNNIIIGKIHTPLNYWNDTYHHGRFFFPTIERPLIFGSNII